MSTPNYAAAYGPMLARQAANYAAALAGRRVEIPPHTDAWMRGDRYGTIEKATTEGALVRMDKSRHALRFNLDELTFE